MEKKNRRELKKITAYTAFLVLVLLAVLLFAHSSYQLPLFDGEAGGQETQWYFGEKGGILSPTRLRDPHLFEPGKTYVLTTELSYDGENAAYPCAFVSSNDFEIRTYLDGKLQFTYTRRERGGPGQLQSVGTANFSVPLGKHCAGRNLTMELGIPLRTAQSRRLPTVDLGDYASYMQNLFKASVPGLLISAAITFFAMVLVILGSRSQNIRRAYIYFAIFSIMVVIYRSAEDLYLIYMFGNPYFAFLCEYLMLTSAAIPLLVSYRYAITPHWCRTLDVCIICLGGILAMQLMLHLTGTVDMTQMYWLNHVTIGGCVAVILVTDFMDRRKKIRRTMFPKLIPIMAGVVLDIVGFYRSLFLLGRGGFFYVGTFTGLGLLVSLIMIVLDARNAREAAYQEGLRNQVLETMAYQDYLTGLQNRAAFNLALDQLPKTGEQVIIAACDLNGLKRVNDSLGHGEGDRLLRRAAQVLKDSFGSRGQVFRTGGDEFFILLQGVTDRDWEALEASFQACLLRNNQGEEVRLSLAMGYAFLEDGDLDRCVQTADMRMYKNKCESPEHRRTEQPDLV